MPRCWVVVMLLCLAVAPYASPKVVKRPPPKKSVVRRPPPHVTIAPRANPSAATPGAHPAPVPSAATPKANPVAATPTAAIPKAGPAAATPKANPVAATPQASPAAATPKANPAAATPAAATPRANPATATPKATPAAAHPPVPNPAPSPAPSPKPPPPPAPPPQGDAPFGSPVFLQSYNHTAPPGYRLALLADAARLKDTIMAFMKVGLNGTGLADGWINGPTYGNQIIGGVHPAINKTGPFMYTTLKVPSGPMFQVIYGNVSNMSNVAYGYRLANCLEMEDYYGTIVGWRNGSTPCFGQQGFVVPPGSFINGTNATVSCPSAAWPLNTSDWNCAVYTRLSLKPGCQYVTGYTFFPGLDVNGSSFDQRIKLQGNASALGDMCTHRKKCTGFNTDGELLTELPPYSQLLPHLDGPMCQGMYTPTQRAGCSLSGYTFYWSYDSAGGSLAAMYNATRETLAKSCSSDARCQGFSTKGVTKRIIQDRTQWTQWTTGKCDGLYLKSGGSRRR